MLPPTPSTAVTAFTRPVAVTMTVSFELADAAGALAIDVPASAATSAAPAAAIRRFFRRASCARQPRAAPNDLTYGIRKSPPRGLHGPNDGRSRKPQMAA